MNGLASTPHGLALLVLLGAIASGINVVAGGGSLIAYPALTLGFGISPVIANATNSCSLWPGSLSGALGYMSRLKNMKRYLKVMLLPTFAGALLGSFLLVRTSSQSFSNIIPWLILLAALMIAFQPRIKSWSESQGHALSPTGGWLVQFLVSTYGGYFGAGMGIMMLGAFALTMEGDIHDLNAVKNWLGVLINFVASVYFVASGIVILPVAVTLTIGGIIGGYLSAKVSQRVPANTLRIAIAVYGLGMAGFFMVRAGVFQPLIRHFGL